MINTIYFSSIESDNFEFDANEEAILWSIGHQCPFAGGEAVYRARILYELIDPTVVYDDVNECLSQGIYRISANEMINNNLVTISGIYPNPANEKVTVYYKGVIQGKIKLQLTEIVGKLIKEHEIDSHNGSFNFDIAELSSGAYLLSISNDSNKSNRIKLIVIK